MCGLAGAIKTMKGQEVSNNRLSRTVVDADDLIYVTANMQNDLSTDAGYEIRNARWYFFGEA